MSKDDHERNKGEKREKENNVYLFALKSVA